MSSTDPFLPSLAPASPASNDPGGPLTPTPQFAFERTEGKTSVESWAALGYQPTIRLWNTCGEHIIVVPLEWATRLGITTLAGLERIVNLMLEDGADVPLSWTRKKDWEASSEPALLPADEQLEADDFVIYRSSEPWNRVAPLTRADVKIGLIPFCAFGTSTAAPSDSGLSQRSAESARKSSFHKDVLFRDGCACIVTDMRDGLETTHLVQPGDKSVYEAIRFFGRRLGAGDCATGVTLWSPLRKMHDSHEAAFLPREPIDGGGGATRPVVFFDYHIFCPPREHPTGKNTAFVKAITALHGTTVRFPADFPSLDLARVHYRRTLLRRFAVARRAMPSPSATEGGTECSSPSATPATKTSRSAATSPEALDAVG